MQRRSSLQPNGSGADAIWERSEPDQLEWIVMDLFRGAVFVGVVGGRRGPALRVDAVIGTAPGRGRTTLPAVTSVALIRSPACK